MIWAVPSFLIIGLIGIYVFLPILFKLKVTTIFEYLDQRFDGKTRLFAVLLCVIPQLVSVAFIVNASALILSTGIRPKFRIENLQMFSFLGTEIDSFLLSILCTAICVFYTAVGGLKAVIWSDLLQFGIIIITYVIVLIAGIQSAGGLKSVFQSAWNGQRLDIFE